MAGYTRLVAVGTLVALLAVSVGVGTASAAVTAVDQPPTVQQVSDDDSTRADAQLNDSGVYWQGQHLGIGNVSHGIENATNLSGVSSLHLREYDADNNELGTLVREIDVESGNQSVATARLEGTYVLLPADQRSRALQFEDGSINGSVAVASAEPFEILVQSLSVEWEPSPPSAVGSERELEVRSNRLRYNVNVTSPDLNYEQLETAFMDTRRLRDQNGPFTDRRPFEQPYRMYDIYEDDDSIVLRGFSEGALQPDFSGFERFPEAVRVEVTDTGVADTAVFSSGAVSGGPFNITELSVTETVDPGEQVTLSATVRNDWQKTDTRAIVFQLGETRNTIETALKAGESTRISTTLTAPEEPGEVEYVVSSEGEAVRGTVTVEAPPPEENSDTSDEGGNGGESGGGFININLSIGRTGMGGIMTGLSLLTVLLFRRR